MFPHRVALTTLLAAAAAAAVPAAGHAAATVTTLEAAGPDVRLSNGIDLAGDGTGGLVFTKAVGGTDHVFLSRRTATGWSAPEQVSTGSGGAAQTQEPKVAAFDGGGLIVAWRAGAGSTLLKAAVSPAAGQPFTTSNVVDLNVVTAYDLDAAPDGSAYVSFTEGTNVRAARLAAPGGSWTLLSGNGNPVEGAVDPDGILDRTVGDEAAGPGGMSESDIAAYPGGAVMTWTESEGGGVTDVIARRLTGSTVGPAIDLTLANLNGTPSAGMTDMTSIAAVADGTAHIAFRQTFLYGADNRPRDVVRVLPPAGAPGPAQVVDGLPADPPEGAEFPAIALSPDGAHGLVGMPRQLSYQTFSSRLTGGTWSLGTRADAGSPDGASTPVAAVGDTGFGVVAWRGTAPTDETVEVASGATALGAPETVSVPGAGPVFFNDVETIAAAAQRDGTSHLVFAQGAAATRRIVVATVPTTVPLPSPTPAPTPAPTATPTPSPTATPKPTRQAFGSKVLVTLPTTVRRRAGRLEVVLRNREPFSVSFLVDVRTRATRGRPSTRLLARTAGKLKAGETRTIRPRIRSARAKRVLRSGTRIALRATVRAPKGKARVVARTARVRTG